MWVTENQVASFHLTCSNPNAIIEVVIYEDDLLKFKHTAQGTVFIPSFYLINVNQDIQKDLDEDLKRKGDVEADGGEKNDGEEEDEEEEKTDGPGEKGMFLVIGFLRILFCFLIARLFSIYFFN